MNDNGLESQAHALESAGGDVGQVMHERSTINAWLRRYMVTLHMASRTTDTTKSLRRSCPSIMRAILLSPTRSPQHAWRALCANPHVPSMPPQWWSAVPPRRSRAGRRHPPWPRQAHGAGLRFNLTPWNVQCRRACEKMLPSYPNSCGGALRQKKKATGSRYYKIHLLWAKSPQHD